MAAAGGGPPTPARWPPTGTLEPVEESVRLRLRRRRILRCFDMNGGFMPFMYGRPVSRRIRLFSARG